MEIGGNIISSVEYDGKISLVIFMAKCPLRCPYCHNCELLESGEETTLKEIFESIDDSIDYIDAVVISGGEPLIQSKDVMEILQYSKSLGLKTKLDTSGCFPEKLPPLLKFVDYIAIDIKAPFNKYEEVIGVDIGNHVKESMRIANNAPNVFVECRTTYVPTLLTHKDIKQISCEISCDLYTLQQFRNKIVLDMKLEYIENPNPHELKKLAKELKSVLNKVKIKTVEFGYEYI